MKKEARIESMPSRHHKKCDHCNVTKTLEKRAATELEEAWEVLNGWMANDKEGFGCDEMDALATVCEDYEERKANGS